MTTHHPIRLRDIAALAHLSGEDFGADIREDRIALRGRRSQQTVPAGLVVHTTDATAETDFETRVMRPPGFVLHMVLAGPVHAWIDDAPIQIGRDEGAPVRIGYSATAHPLPFLRRASAGEYLRKVNIGLSWDWLAARGFSATDILQGNAQVQHHWTATPVEAALGEALVALDARQSDPAAGLRREALALALVSWLLDRLSCEDGGLRPDEADRLARMEAFAAAPGPIPDLDAIAEAGRMSLSSARRLFQKAHGTPIRARIRELRLLAAYERLQRGATIAEVAHDAGFVSPESFATAFGRRFGTSPSQLRQRSSTSGVCSGRSSPWFQV